MISGMGKVFLLQTIGEGLRKETDQVRRQSNISISSGHETAEEGIGYLRFFFTQKPLRKLRSQVNK